MAVVAVLLAAVVAAVVLACVVTVAAAVALAALAGVVVVALGKYPVGHLHGAEQHLGVAEGQAALDLPPSGRNHP